MTATATPATVATRMGMLGGVLRGAGARIGTDEDPAPVTFQRKIDAARSGETAAQTITNAALLDLAITEGALADARQALLDMTVHCDAMRAELASHGPLLDVVADDFRRGLLSPNLHVAWLARGDR